MPTASQILLLTKTENAMGRAKVEGGLPNVTFFLYICCKNRISMKTPTLFKEYIWLVNTIRKAGRITLAEINERWALTEMSGGLPLARATFNRHKDAIHVACRHFKQ